MKRVLFGVLIVLSGCADPEAGGPAEDASLSEESSDSQDLFEEPSWDEGPAVFCESETIHRWSLEDPEDVHFFPDPLLQIEDATSPTGFRIVLSEETIPWLESVPDILSDGVQSFDGRSGFGSVGDFFSGLRGPVWKKVPPIWRRAWRGRLDSRGNRRGWGGDSPSF